MNEEEINNSIELLKKAVDDYHKTSEHLYYFDEYQMSTLRQLTFQLADRLNEEKEKNKKLEEEYAKAIESEADIAVGSHKLINNLAQAIRFMSTNENLTVEDIIKEFTENPLTDDFMERWEKTQYEESNLRDKVIDMIAEDIFESGRVLIICEKMKESGDCFAKNYGSQSCWSESCLKDCIREYYFNKVKENEK